MEKFSLILFIIIVLLFISVIAYFIVGLEHRKKTKLGLVIICAIFFSSFVYYFSGNWQFLFSEVSEVDKSFENLSTDDQQNILQLTKEKFEDKLKNSTLAADEYVVLAQVYLLQDDLLSAQDVLMQAIDRQIQDPEILRLLARLSQSEDSELSYESWQKLLRLLPDDFEALYFSGLYELANNNNSVARDYFVKAIDVIPSSLSNEDTEALTKRIKSIIAEIANTK